MNKRREIKFQYSNIYSKLFTVLLLTALTYYTASANWNTSAFEANTINDALSQLYGDQNTELSHDIHIKVPEVAENGNVVPITIQTSLKNVTAITIFADGNINPLVAHQIFPLQKNVQLSTRVKLRKRTNISVVVQSEGKLYTANTFVKVTIGGCGGGGTYSGDNYGSYSGYTAQYGSSSSSQHQSVVGYSPYLSNEKYQSFENNSIIATSEQRTSTFSIDVDTGSYSNIRRIIKSGQIPPKDAVRIEEMLNYFDYEYVAPREPEVPFHIHSEISVSPWNSGNHLLQIGIKGYELPPGELPPLNLVFLIDVSGSMQSPNKLELLKSSITMLAKQLREIDRVAIVVYAGGGGVVLPSTSGRHKQTILSSLERLTAGGSTNGGEGIHVAYSMAKQSYVEDGINRILLGTDGDFNVGVTNTGELIKLVENQRKDGIYLTTLGFGTGNYNEELMEQLADKGNGNYAYIDNMFEARKVLVDEMVSTLNVIAKDVKIQVEFNPSVVAEYRLIGYENRVLKNSDFKNDKVDAGEIGAGHTVTALYEFTLIESKHRALEPQRYTSLDSQSAANQNEIGILRLRYKQPDSEESNLLQHYFLKENVIQNNADTTHDFRFAASVAAIGQIMRNGDYINENSINEYISLAKNSLGSDPNGYRHEFVRMIELYQSMRQ